MAEHTLVLKPQAGTASLATKVAFVLDGIAQEIEVDGAAEVAYERCDPVRMFVSWPGKRNYSGSYWSSTTGMHVGFESLFECTALMTLDRDPDIIGISSQPMWLRWPSGHVPRSHAPDYFARHRNGDGEIVDVRPEKLIDELTAAVFESTRRLCVEAGFRYRVISRLSEELGRNLKFLSPYRHNAWMPPTGAVEAISARCPVTTVLELARHLSPGDQSRGLGQVYWLIWHQALQVSLNQRLSLRTRIALHEADAR